LAFEAYQGKKKRLYPTFRIDVGNFVIFYHVDGDKMVVERPPFQGSAIEVKI
jgi:mRNA-degrading endonuclease RelE of RelBE toxin-antitoxin system